MMETIHNQARTARLRGDMMRGRGEGKSYTKLYGRHEHRVVMEAKLGRPLLSEEIVHHIDHNKKNNHPDNLMVMTRSEHARHHATKNRLCGIRDCGRTHRQRGYCDKHRRIYKDRIEPCQR